MQEFVSTLLVSCVPAVITGVVTYFTANKNANTQIKTLSQQNQHEIEKLMEQHKIDIEALNEKHRLDMESKEREHEHKLEIMQKENENAILKKERELEDTVKYQAMGTIVGDLFKNPEALSNLSTIINNPLFNKDSK